jgi:outer membrane protein assembly factor BamB
VWSIALDAGPTAGGAIDAERVYLPLRNERIVALSRVDGRTVWSRDVESSTTPVVGAGVVYVLASDEVHALDAATGDERWRADLEPHLNIGLAVVGDRLFAVLEPATLVAISAADGSIVWRRPLASPPLHAVISDGSRLYVAMADGTVAAVLASDGQGVWQMEFEGTLARPALVADRLIVGTAANEIFALDSRSGTLAWRWRVGGDVVGAAGGGELVFAVALDNMLRAVSRSSGNQRWKKPISSRPAHPPQVFGDLVVVTSVAPTVSVYSALTGTVAGTYVAPAEIEGPVLIAPAAAPSGAVMVVATRDGRVVGLRPKPPVPPPAAPTSRPATPLAPSAPVTPSTPSSVPRASPPEGAPPAPLTPP